MLLVRSNILDFSSGILLKKAYTDSRGWEKFGITHTSHPLFDSRYK